jgi:phosphoribosylamine--glycine ligase
MNVLVLGSGGREHALAWKLRQSPRVDKLYALPGSDGMAELAEAVAGDPNSAEDVLTAVERLKIDLTVIGPEAPLAAGITDALEARGHAVFGPSRQAAQLETSKIFAKRFMERHGIPTARFFIADSADQARRVLAEFSYPVVIKADGLAAGKGVVIAQSKTEAVSALTAMFSGELVGEAGARVVIEECLKGEELSLLALCDGEQAIALIPAQDHKRAFDNDQGPNTGGMGAYSIDTLLPDDLKRTIQAQILEPTMRGMAAEGAPFKGVLYCGLMLTEAGPQVLEYNTRFGDPETQAILLRFDGDLAQALDAVAKGKLEAGMLRWSDEPAACIILASGGYPGPYSRGIAMRGLEAAAADPGVVLFHAGTKREGNNGWVTNGGRVLGVAARATTLEGALERCYMAASRIQFEGIHYRSDIGARALNRVPKLTH